MRPSRLLLSLLLCLSPQPALLHAQSTAATAIGVGGIDQLFGRVESINIYYGGRISTGPRTSSVARTRLPWAKDYGLEFLLHVGEFGRFTAAHERRAAALAERRRLALDSLRAARAEHLRRPGTTRPAVRDSIIRRFAADSARLHADAESPFTPTSITIRKHVTISGGDTVLAAVDSEFVGNRAPPPADERVIDLDLGIGYGQMDGLRSSGPFELHGSVRELPSISAYATARLRERLGVYAGVRTGIITLQDAQLFVTRNESTSMFTLTSTSFEFGVPLGIDVQPVEGIHLTLEGAYMRRIFNSLSFDPATDIPFDYPRSLDLSGFSWSVGLQFPVP